MVSHGLLFRTVVYSELFNAPSIVDFVTDSNVPCDPSHSQAHERSSSVNHKLRKVPNRKDLGVAMMRSNQVGHVELANAGVAGDDVTTLRVS